MFALSLFVLLPVSVKLSKHKTAETANHLSSDLLSVMTGSSLGDPLLDLLVQQAEDEISFRVLLAKLEKHPSAQYNGGTTLLMELVKQDSFDAIMVLAVYSSNSKKPLGVNLLDDSGFPALFYGLRKGNVQLLEYLVKELKATPTINTADGRNIFDILFDASEKEIAPKMRLRLLPTVVNLYKSIPPFLRWGHSVVQEVLYYGRVMIEDGPGTERQGVKLIMNTLEFLREKAESKRDLNHYRTVLSTCSDGGNVFHECAMNYLLPVMEYFLKIFKAKGASFLKEEIEKLDDENWTPLLTCCCNEYSLGSQKSRVPFIEKLIEAGAAVDEFILNRDLTPLSFAVTHNTPTMIRQQAACALIDHNADLFKTMLKKDTPAFKILTRETSFILKHVLRKKLLPPETCFSEIFDHCAMHVAASLAVRDFSHIAAAGIKKKMKKRMKLIELLYKYKFPLKGTCWYLLCCLDGPAGRYVFKRLLELGASVHQENTIRLPLITCCVAKNDFRYFRILIDHYADIKIKSTVSLCRNMPPHRWLSFENIKEKSEADEHPSSSTNTCSLCMAILTADTGRMSSCASNVCDFYLCGECTNFRVGSKKRVVVDPSLLARRKCSVLFLNNLHFLAETEIGEVFLHRKLPNQAVVRDLFMNAGISNGKITKKLTAGHLARLGVTEESRSQALMSLLGPLPTSHVCSQWQ